MRVKRMRVRWFALVLTLTLLGLYGVVAPALADGPGYTLERSTVDGGGTTSRAVEGYGLRDTLGQPDAQTWAGGGYVLNGGFWGGSGAPGDGAWLPVYLPLLVRTYP